MEKGMYMVLIVAAVAVVSLVFLTLNAGNVGTLAFGNGDLVGMANEGASAGLPTNDAGGTQTVQEDDNDDEGDNDCETGCINIKYICYSPCIDRNNECLASVQDSNRRNPSGRFKTSSGFGTSNAMVACHNAYTNCLGRCTTYFNTCMDNC